MAEAIYCERINSFITNLKVLKIIQIGTMPETVLHFTSHRQTE